MSMPPHDPFFSAVVVEGSVTLNVLPCFHTLKWDLAAMNFDSPARDGQSQSRATPLAGAEPIDSIEAVEYVCLMVRGHTRTLINYFNIQPKN
jgi:hypothetical protein